MNDIEIKFLLHQLRGMESTKKEILLSGAYGSGKAQPKSCIIITPYGKRSFGDIKVGDFVIGANGKPTKVIAIYEQGEIDTYKITFTDGSSTECNNEHLWSVWTNDTKQRNRPNKVLTTEQISKNLFGNDGYCNYFIPMTSPVEFEAKDLKIHPYLLGLLLGDGGLSNTGITFTTSDLEIVQYIKYLLPDKHKINKISSKFGYSISGNYHNEIIKELRKLNLFSKKSETKFIPDIYKYSCVQDRIEILRGLFDTDGSLTGTSGVDYVTVSKQLAYDVQEIVESLGGRAKIQTKQTHYLLNGEKKNCQLAYRLYINLPDFINPFRLKRKADKWIPHIQREPTRGIKKIEYIGKKDSRCISVDNSDGLYLTNNYIVTHNSWWLCNKIVFLLNRYPRNRGFLCRKTLQSLKTSTLKTLLQGDGDTPAALPAWMIKNHNKQERAITLYNDSELFYGNMDIEFIKSMNLGFAAVDEATELTEEEWNALKGRLRLANIPIRQLFGATNPGSPYHWLYNRFVVNPLKDKKGNIVVDFIKSKTSDNYYLPEDYIDDLKRTLFGFFYERYVNGEWVGAEDVVYDNFDFKTHIIPNFEIPKSWKRYRAVDFGYRAPFSCCWFAIAGNDAKNFGLKKDDMVLYREIYYTQRTTSINGKRVKELSLYPDNTPEKIEYTVCDWDAGDRADLEAVGIKTVKANKDIALGIQKVRERLGNVDPTRGDLVEPRFYILQNTLAEYDPKIRIDIATAKTNNDPTRSAEEFTVYAWDKAKEKPLDIFDHAMDAIRYFVVQYDMKRQWSNVEFLHL